MIATMIRACVLAALCTLACGKQTFLAAAFMQTPQLPNPTDPNGNIPAFQVMTAYFGTIDTSNPTHIDSSVEAPITDATAAVAFHHKGTGGSDVDEDRVLPVPAAASPAGAYELSSRDDNRLTFETGVPYTLVLQTAGQDGEAFGARFVPGPPADIEEFRTSHCNVALPPPVTSYSAPRCVEGAVLTIHRTDTAGDLLPAFVLVGKFDPSRPTADPQVTYKTVPDTADKLLKFVLSDRDYRKPSFDIPASAYPGHGYYIVSLMVVKQGKVSGNAFIGSTALAGTGAAGIVHIP
jgi:hypothetical protein